VSFCTSMMVFSWSRQFLPSRHPPLQRPRVRPRLPCLMRLLPLRCLQPPQPRHQQTHVGGRRRCCRCCACSSERRQRRDKDDKSREHTPCGAAPTRQRPPRRIPAPARCAASCCPERRSGGGGSAICSARRQAELSRLISRSARRQLGTHLQQFQCPKVCLESDDLEQNRGSPR
jgi:hypothetical protein